MDLVFFGTPKTATTSLFHMLSYHPEISTSDEKEYFNSLVKKDMSKHLSVDYDIPYDISVFNINHKTKVLMDGTSNLFTFVNEGLLDKIKAKTKVENIKCIYVLRNPIDRFLSSINFQTQLFESGDSYERFPNKQMFKDGKLIFNRCLLLWLIARSDINNLYSIETVFSRENMFICKLKDLKESQKKMYKFLNIDDTYHFDLPELNQTDHKDEATLKKVRDNRKFINRVCIQSLKSVKAIYNIDTDDLILDVLRRRV